MHYDDMDDLGRYLHQQRKRERSHLTPSVLRQFQNKALPSNTQIVEGTGGSMVLRTRAGARVTKSGT